MANISTPGNFTRKEQEGAAHVAPVKDKQKGQPTEKRQGDADREEKVENELEDGDQYPG